MNLTRAASQSQPAPQRTSQQVVSGIVGAGLKNSGVPSSRAVEEAPSGGGSSRSAGAKQNVWEALCAKLQDVAEVEEKLPSDERRALEKEVMTTLPTLEPTRAADLVMKTYGVFVLQNEELLDDLCKALTPNIPRFRSPDLTRLTSTLASWATAVGHSDDSRSRLTEPLRAFFNGISAEVSLRLMDVAPADLAKMATALASVGVGGVRLFASIARAAVARADRFGPTELVALIGAFDRGRCFQTALFEALARCMRREATHMPPKDLVKGMNALGFCGIKVEGLEQAIGDYFPKKAIASGAINPEESCALAWSFCSLDLHHDKLFRAVFRALEDAPVQASETLCQLYEIHLTLKAFHRESYGQYELEEDTVQSLRDHYRKHKGGKQHRDVKPERSSERLHNDVADLLKDVVECSVATQHVHPSLGFAVDIAALPRKSSKSSKDKAKDATPLVCIDLDGPHGLLRSLDPAEHKRSTTGFSPQDAVSIGGASRVRGTIALKRRIMKSFGVKLVVFSEDDWRGLDGERARREFLKGMLRREGLGEDKFRR